MKFKGYPTDTNIDDKKEQGIYYAGGLKQPLDFWGCVLVLNINSGILQAFIGSKFAWRILMHESGSWGKINVVSHTIK